MRGVATVTKLPSRRAFLLAGIGAVALPCVARGEEGPAVGGARPRWQPGMLDIHHLAMGRGDATVIVAPDGTVALLDAGAVGGNEPALVEARPDASRTPGEWIARYVGRLLLETGSARLHAAMISHLHPDHIGRMTQETPRSADGAYGYTGISDVARHVPVATLLDPDWPDYGYPKFEDAVSAQNYVAFARAFARAGGRVERLQVGTSGQLLPDSAGFAATIVAARGRVWTGKERATVDVFPPRLSPDDAPTENAAASAIRLAYGGFCYFTASDMTDWGDAGTRPWMNALTRAASAVGPVDVSTLAHHGMYDGSSPATIRALAARNWVISAWHAVHPNIETLECVFNARLYDGPRDVFSTALHPAADLAMRRLTRRFASSDGHVICRVEPGGGRYRMLVTDSRDEADRLTYVGPSLVARGNGP